MNVHDKEWSSSSWGGSYSHQRHSPLPSPIHPSQHHHAAVPPPPSTSQQPSAAPEVASNYMSYYYSSSPQNYSHHPPPHPQQHHSYFYYYSDSRPPFRRSDSSPTTHHFGQNTMSSQPATPQPSSPTDNAQPREVATTTTPPSASSQQVDEQAARTTTATTATAALPPAVPSSSVENPTPTSPTTTRPTMTRTRQSSAAYTVNEPSPKFGATKYLGNVYAPDRTTVLDIRIQSRFDRGFFIADNDWTCYRRNYFQVSGAFTIQNYPPYYLQQQQHPEPVFYVRDPETDQLHEVRGFFMGISARVADDDKTIALIQHTAKRDKGPQTEPVPKPIQPGGDLSLLTSMASATATGIPLDQTIVTFERIQFKSATANNGKRRAAQQYYVLSVELFARIDSGQLIKVASNRSAQLVVRGRSPGHYSERRTSNQSSTTRDETTAAVLSSSSSSSPSVPLPNNNSSTERPSPRSTGNNGLSGGPTVPEYAYYNGSSGYHLPAGSAAMMPPPSYDAQPNMVRGTHDRSISAPSGSVEFHQNNHHAAAATAAAAAYGLYPQREHHAPWVAAHTRMSSSGHEPMSPYMPPPYYYYSHYDHHHQRSQSGNPPGAIGSPGLMHSYHQGVPSTYRPMPPSHYSQPSELPPGQQQQQDQADFDDQEQDKKVIEDSSQQPE